MKKEAFYFPHFSNARHDRKIRRLRKELGVEGYGIYFMLLETLREQQDLMYPLEDLDLLAEEFGVSEAKVKATICGYELFEIDAEEKFFSPKMLVYLEPYFRMKEQRREAGLKSAAKRQLNESSTTVQQSKVKEIKVKETKVKETKVLTAREMIFEKWYKYKAEKKQSYTPTGKDALIKTWSSYSDEQLERIIDTSISNNWAGLFAPKFEVASQAPSQPQLPRTTISIPDNY
jgi:Domain of unknown function (DUF4373)